MAEFYGTWHWERAVVLELNREHKSICRVHRVNLRPIAITLFDSESLWGQFDHLTRTISISRKLITDFPWHCVIGVFRHEMAHQYVAENDPSKFLANKPHDQLFKEACRRLGVPEQFAKAGLNLQNTTLDWRDEPRNEATEKILDKVKKLLALANSTNEHEALLAMARVRELYAKYNLEHMETLARETFVHLVITHRKKRMESWEQRIISILTEHFFVKVLTFQQFEPKTGQRVHALEVIGTKENVLMAEYVYHFLLRHTEFLVRQVLAGGSTLARSERRSYRLGLLDGFSRKLKSAEKSEPNGNQSGVKTNALTVIGQALSRFRDDPRLDDYLSEVYPRLGSRRKSSVQVDYQAFAAGREAGKSITLHKPISSQPTNQGKLLSDNK